MESLGRYLKQIRNSHGKTIEDAANHTRVVPEYIEALEADDYSKIPNEVMAKGFLRLYARFLSLDEDDIFERYNQYRETFYHGENNEDIENIIKVELPDGEKRSRISIWIASIITISIAIIIIISLHNNRMIETRNQEGYKDSPSPLPSPLSAEGKEEMGEGKKTMMPKDAPSDLPLDTETEKPFQEKAKKQKLTIEALETTWIVIKIDNSEEREFLLQKGEKITWKADKNFMLTIGNAGGVKVFFNKKELEPFGVKGEVVRDILLPLSKVGPLTLPSPLGEEG
ncbi:MAG: helix-turn-helix domain-containing protein [Nitrospirota bacterium]